MAAKTTFRNSVLRALGLAFLFLIGAEMLLRFTLKAAPVPFDPAPFRPEQSLLLEWPDERAVVIGNAIRGRPVTRDKAPGTFRILVVGESAIYGMPQSLAASPPWRLERLLQARFPSQSWEVINLGQCARSTSEHKENLSRAVSILHPDLVIIQTGNNEYWPLLAYRLANPSYDSRTESASCLFRRSWLYGLLFKTVTRWTPPPTINRQPPSHAEIPLQPGDDALVREAYQHNLEEMCQECKRHNVPVVLCTVPVNRLNEVRLTKHADPAARLAELSSRDHAEAASCLIELGRIAEARRELDRDFLLFSRAPPWTSDVVFEVGRRLGVPVCDVSAELDAAAPLKIAGDETYVRANHFKRVGAIRVAAIWLAFLRDHKLIPDTADTGREGEEHPASLALEDRSAPLEMIEAPGPWSPAALAMMQQLAQKAPNTELRRGWPDFPSLDVSTCKDVDLLRVYGYTMLLELSPRQALACYLRVLELVKSPTADMYFDAAIAAIECDQTDKARELLEKGLALRPDPTMARKLATLRLVRQLPVEPIPTVVGLP